MKKRIRNLIKSLSLGCMPMLLILSCGGSTTEVERASSNGLSSKDVVQAVRERKFAKFSNKTPVSPYLYYHDSTRSYGTTTTQYYYSSLPIRIAAANPPVISQTVKLVDGEPVTETVMVKPSINYIRFESVAKVVLFVDGKQIVFDSDDYDSDVKTTGRPVVYATSNNKRSINSAYFREQLAKTRKMSFVVRDAVWGDYSGNPTKYKLDPRDILFTFLRTLLRTVSYRHKYGGTKELDEYWFAKTNQDFFKPDSFYPNEYLFQLFDVDYLNTLDFENPNAPHKPIETLNIDGVDTEVFSIYLNDSAENIGQLEAFFDFFIKTSAYYLAPSQYLLEQSRLRTDKHDGTGLVKKIGYYYYGEREQDMLFASPFIPFYHEVTGGLETFRYRQNPQYWDTEWLANPNVTKEVVITNSKSESTTFHAKNYANFTQGVTTTLSFNDIAKTTADTIREGNDPNIPASLIKTVPAVNVNSIPFFFKFTTTPEPSKDEKGNIDTSVYKYNDAYARFMYGAPLAELARGNVQTLHSFFGDDQISFRSLLVAGVNWYRAVLDTSGGQRRYSLTLAAPDAIIGGSDQSTSKYPTMAAAYDLSNTAWSIFEGKRSIEVPISENIAHSTSPSIITSYMGGGPKIYAQLQSQMTQLLDRVYAKLGLTDDQQLAAEFSFTTTSEIPAHKNAIESVLTTINNLDKKGRIHFTHHQYKTVSEAIAVFGKYTARTSGGWGYDWEGNGTYIDAMLHRDHAFYAAYLAKLLARREDDPDNPFPLLTRLAHLLDADIKKGTVRFAVPMREWMNAENGQSWRPLTYLSTDTGSKKIISSAEFAKFFFRAQKLFTNEEHVRLDNEISILIGFKFNDTATVADPVRGAQMIYQRGYRAPAYGRTPAGFGILDGRYDPLDDD